MKIVRLLLPLAALTLFLAWRTIGRSLAVVAAPAPPDVATAPPETAPRPPDDAPVPEPPPHPVSAPRPPRKSFGRLVAIPVGPEGATDPVQPDTGLIRARRLIRRHVVTAAWLALAVAWFFTLRPVAWGGPAGYHIVAGVSMQPTLDNGDLVVTSAQASYQVGDVVAYRVPEGKPSAGSIVVHRITGGDGQSGYVTRGDNVGMDDPWHPRVSDVIGRSWIHVPGAGRIFLSLRTPFVLALVMGLIAGGWWFLTSGSQPTREPTTAERRPRRFQLPHLRRRTTHSHA